MKRIAAFINKNFISAAAFVLAGVLAFFLASCRHPSEPVIVVVPTKTPEVSQVPTEVPSEMPTETAAAAESAAPTGDISESIAPSPGPETVPPVTETAPAVTDPPATNPPATNPPATKPPATNPPATNPPKPSPAPSGRYTIYDGTTIVCGNAAYEITFRAGSALKTETKYVGLLSTVSEALKGKTDVYSLLIPTAYGITLPEDVRDSLSFYYDMNLSIEETFSLMPASLKPVRCYDKLKAHKAESIYFRADHHWTGRGAYYAYAAFMETKGVVPHALSEYKTVDFKGFLGSIYRRLNVESLLPAETVTAYYPISSDVSMQIHRNNGTVINSPVVVDVSSSGAGSKYGAYAGGDNPLTVITNPTVTDGSTLIIVKESFGNPLIAFLSDHYSTIYEIDYRHWKGNLISFAEEVGATDLLFTNCLTLIYSGLHHGHLAGIIK